MKFVERYAPTVDVFCFQEVFDTTQADVDFLHPDEYLCGNLFQRLERLIGGCRPQKFTGEFAFRPDSPTRMSQALFYRNSLPAIAYGSEVIHQPEQPVEDGSAVISGRMMQYLMVDQPNGSSDCLKPMTVINYHGLWGGGGKTDTPERLEQSRRLRRLMDEMPGPIVLCGDLNLLPETESLRILDSGHRNLVLEGTVKTTRTPLYRHYHDSRCPKMADYVIVSSGVRVQQFQVMPDLASDHAPLLLDFDW
jgi:hypothetical protein